MAGSSVTKINVGNGIDRICIRYTNDAECKFKHRRL